MIVGYCQAGPLDRRSSLQAQKAALIGVGAQTIYEERTGLTGGAPELERALASLRSGDTLVVTRPYRVARTVQGVMAVISRLSQKGAGFRILGTPVDTSTTTGRMILGSTPLWSLGVSPMRAALGDLFSGSRR